MKRLLLGMTLVMIAAGAVAESPQCEGEKLGAGVSSGSLTPGAEILAAPQKYEGQVVRVEGTVQAVCKKMGCWMELAVADTTTALRVKVKDGEIVFPASAKGHRAIAEGKVERRVMTAEEYRAFLEHQAEEQGQKFDPATVGSGRHEFVQLRGLGAVVCKAAAS